MRRILFAVLLSYAPSHAVAQEVGDYVVVTQQDAPLKSGSDVSGTVPRGTALTVRATNGNWFWVVDTSGSATRKGWVARSHCAALDQALELLASQPSAPAEFSRVRGTIYRIQGDTDRALVDLTQAIRLDPNAAQAYHERAAAWLQKRDVERAVADCEEALRLDPQYVPAYITRALARSSQGDQDQALADLNEALRIDPENPLAHQHRAFVRNQQGNYEQAVGDLNEAIRLDPQDPMAYFNRATTLGRLGKYDEAIDDFGRTIRLDPDYAPAHCNRGTVYKLRQDFAQARENYEKAVQMDPRYSLARNALAWLLATCPDEQYRDGARAVEHAQAACELSGWSDPGSLDTLAAAYAEAGDFAAAVERQQQAVELASETEKEGYAARLALYQQQQPYRDEPRAEAP